MTTKIIIEIDMDAHDDTYYRVLQDSYILMERLNGLDNLMIFLKAKIESIRR
jgi:deoxyadenosine/deoxycytidine kinase